MFSKYHLWLSDGRCFSYDYIQYPASIEMFRQQIMNTTRANRLLALLALAVLIPLITASTIPAEILEDRASIKIPAADAPVVKMSTTSLLFWLHGLFMVRAIMWASVTSRKLI